MVETMDMKERVIEGIQISVGGCSRYWAETVANYLIDKGLIVKEVTARESGCVYCEEDFDGYRKVLGAFSITNPFHKGEYFLNTGHCKPRQIYFCPMCGRKLEKG